MSPAGSVLASESAFKPTPGDYEGPFYPLGSRDQDTNNLIPDGILDGDTLLRLNGELRDTNGNAIPGAVIDVWHTDTQGRYLHPKDSSPGERRQDFRYWGQATTDANGKFFFRTLLPGGYSRRPAHVHYKVWQGKQRLLTSQIYFRQLGGHKGRSRSKSELQVADLVQTADANFQADYRIVI